MTRLLPLAAAAIAVFLPLAACARDGLSLMDPFARVTPTAGAVYLYIDNPTDTPDRLLAVSSPAAQKMMPMTTKQSSNGMMEMVNVPEGFPIPAHGHFVLAPGHEHLMLMGLTRKLHPGDTIEVTLTFAWSGAVTLTVPVTTTRVTAPEPVPTPYNAQTGTDGKLNSAPAAAPPNPPADSTGGN